MTRTSLLALWLIAALFAAFNLITSVVPALLPAGLIGIANTLLLVGFAIVHGSRLYGMIGIAVFLLASFVVGNIFENLSILTGFPFGRYHYTDVLGARLFLVPVTIFGAYFGAGYLSWTVAQIVLDRIGQSFDMFAQWAVPVVAAVLMTSWDFMLDPHASTVDRYWIWEHGGGYFGVPLSNFAGWLLTVFIFFAIFAAYVRKTGKAGEKYPMAFWALPIAMYALLAERYVIAPFVHVPSRGVTDAAGHLWMTHDINEAGALAGMFTILAFVLIAALRLARLRYDLTL